MAMDPVLLALEEIHAVEAMLDEIRGAPQPSRQRAELAAILEIWLGDLQASLPAIIPTSIIGAAALIRAAARDLPEANRHLAPQMDAIAQRMAEGQRHPFDIIWLRRTITAWPDGCDAARHLLNNAVQGATRPVVIWRGAPPALKPQTIAV